MCAPRDATMLYSAGKSMDNCIDRSLGSEGLHVVKTLPTRIFRAFWLFDVSTRAQLMDDAVILRSADYRSAPLSRTATGRNPPQSALPVATLEKRD